MWTVVYMAQGKDIAEKIKEALEKEGLLVKLRPISKVTDEESTGFEVLVPESEVEEAHSIIIETGF